MKIYLRKYRIVKDAFAGFEVQKWRLYFPFWIQIDSKSRSVNTSSSVEKADELIEYDKNRPHKPIVVKTYECD